MTSSAHKDIERKSVNINSQRDEILLNGISEPKSGSNILAGRMNSTGSAESTAGASVGTNQSLGVSAANQARIQALNSLNSSWIQRLRPSNLGTARETAKPLRNEVQDAKFSGENGNFEESAMIEAAERDGNVKMDSDRPFNFTSRVPISNSILPHAATKSVFKVPADVNPNLPNPWPKLGSASLGVQSLLNGGDLEESAFRRENRDENGDFLLL